jgi:hypothetical protein
MAAWPEAVQAPPTPIEVSPVLVRDGREVGVVHDGAGCAMIASLTAGQPGPGESGPPRIAELSVGALARLFDPSGAGYSGTKFGGTGFSQVEIILHADLAASDPASRIAETYQNLGYHRVPRSQSAWIVLRQESAGAADEASARALAEHAIRALDHLPGQVRAQLADAETARELAGTEPLAARFCAAAGVVIRLVPSRPQPSFVPNEQLANQQRLNEQLVYRLTRWPAAGLPALQQALMTIAALSVTTTVAIGGGRPDRVEAAATIRVTPWPMTSRPDLEHTLLTAAVGCGTYLEPMPSRIPVNRRATRLVSLPPVKTTLGHGRFTVPPVHAGKVAIPVAPGGIVLAAESSGEPVAVPFFTPTGPTRSAVVGDPMLPKLMALRALGAGARLQVVTSRPREWLRLRRCAWLSAGSMAVVRPGTPPPADGTRAAPWMIIDDTSEAAAPASVAAAAGAGRPWQALVAAPDAGAVTIAALRGLEFVILHRSTPACRAAVIAALDLQVPVTRSLHGIPRDAVAIASPGIVSLGALEIAPSERALIRRSMQPLPPGPASSAWPVAGQDAQLRPSIRSSNQCRLVAGPGGEDA